MEVHVHCSVERQLQIKSPVDHSPGSIELNHPNVFTFQDQRVKVIRSEIIDVVRLVVHGQGWNNGGQEHHQQRL